MKICSKCLIQKSLSDFSACGMKFQSYCKLCQDTYRKEYRKKYPEIDQKWRDNNKIEKSIANVNWRKRKRIFDPVEAHRRDRAANYRKKYGITIEQYEQMFRSQDGACAICEKIWTGGKRLGVDHNHTTGRVRKLLCDGCNIFVGFYEKHTSKWPKIISYVEKHKIIQECLL